MSVELLPVTIDNWYKCTKLKVKKEQLSVFPAPIVYWIAESKYVTEFELRAIYVKSMIVGFLVYTNKPDKDNNTWIIALMIDEEHQGKGYGKRAMKKLIEQMRLQGNTKVMIGHRPNNHIAAQLYESLGFNKVSDEVIDGEIIRVLLTS